jgi:hypothetical protein
MTRHTWVLALSMTVVIAPHLFAAEHLAEKSADCLAHGTTTSIER